MKAEIRPHLLNLAKTESVLPGQRSHMRQERNAVSRGWGLFLAGILVGVVAAKFHSRFALDEVAVNEGTSERADEPAWNRHEPRTELRTPEVSAVSDGASEQSAGPIPPPNLDVRELDVFLARAGRSPANLIAAWRLSDDSAFLREAVTLFPDNPQVQFALLQADLFPEERLDWLKRFKITAEDNPLPSFLLARELLQAGGVDAAIAEIVATRTRSRFSDYFAEELLARESAFLEAGHSPGRAKMGAMSVSVSIQELGQIRKVVSDENLIRRVKELGEDTWSQFADAVFQLAESLQSGPGRHVTHQMVGHSLEAMILAHYPNDLVIPALGGTPAEVRQAHAAHLDQRREFARRAPTILRASEEELIGYFDRLKVLGELEAMHWLAERHGLRATEPTP